MKKTTLSLVCVLLAAVLCLPLLTGCGKRLVMSGTRLTDKQNHVSYSDVSGTYLAKAVSSEVYATFRLNGVKKNFYTIEGLDPLEWLSSEYGELFYSGTEVLPGLGGFGAESILICTNSDIPMSLYDIQDKALVERIVLAFESGENVDISNYLHADYYSVRFSSSRYPSLYYALKMVVTDDGVFLYSRYDGIAVAMGDLFEGYVPDLYSYDEEDY